MASETKRINGKTCVSTALLCEFFGITRQAANLWEKQGCPKEARGYWCVADVLRWRLAADSESGGNVEELPLTQQKIYWETRCKEEQAENSKFKNAVIRGDYLKKSQMERDLADFFVVLKQSVLSLPRKSALIAARYIGNDRARSLENELAEVMSDALAQWSDGRFAPGMDRECAADVAAAGEDHGERVGRPKKGTRRKKQQ